MICGIVNTNHMDGRFQSRVQLRHGYQSEEYGHEGRVEIAELECAIVHHARPARVTGMVQLK